MYYTNKEVRRQDRTLDEPRAIELLKTAEYGVLSMIDGQDKPYGIPVNYVWDGKEYIYIHCATAGRKLQAITSNDLISFCIVGRVKLLPKQFTTEYESIVIEGTAETGLSDEEKMQALKLLINKYSPEDTVIGYKYAQKSFHRVDIIKVKIHKMSGKQKAMKEPPAYMKDE